MLRSDRDMRVLSSKNQKSKFSQKFSIFPSTNEKHHKSANFQDFSQIFLLHGLQLPPCSTYGSTLILGGIQKPQKA